MLCGAQHALFTVMQTRHWLDPRTMTFFGIMSLEEARATLDAARRQGRANLLLALMAVIGAIMLAVGGNGPVLGRIAVTLMTAALLCMAFAALMSIIAEPYRRKWAALQLVLPALTLALLACALLFG